MLREPRPEKRKALLAKLKAIFQHNMSQPIGKVMELTNPILRGWVNYFAYGHSARCFSYLRTWVERKVRRHMMRARGLPGFGWNRWSRRWLVEELGLFDNFHVRWTGKPSAKALPDR